MALARRIVAAVIVVAILAMTVPVNIASTSNTAGMPCCAGKAAGHCDAGLHAKLRKPKPEPMCGLKTKTIVADDVETVAEPTGPAVAQTILRQPCHTDCCSGVISSSKQSKRDRSTARTTHQPLRPTNIHFGELLTRPLAQSNLGVKQITLRGPPTRS